MGRKQNIHMKMMKKTSNLFEDCYDQLYGLSNGF
jgi:hypothetical protein